ncbi:50S ribosomal protein L6 [bacterium]|nr:50S ribosomal protein L6 [candidate division CSSED10-310 bacterium]
MSRIGKLPITIPSGVEVKVKGQEISVKGPLGALQYFLPDPISIDLEKTTVTLKRESDHRDHRALHGLARALIANMIHGVSKGFEKSLIVDGVGYKVGTKGNALVLSIGYSHPVEYAMPAGVTVSVEKNKIVLKGIDKQNVGQTAAIIREFRPVEPYKGKGIRYENEKVRRKEGKVGT